MFLTVWFVLLPEHSHLSSALFVIITFAVAVNPRDLQIPDVQRVSILVNVFINKSTTMKPNLFFTAVTIVELITKWDLKYYITNHLENVH